MGLLLIEDERSSYSVKRYLSHVKRVIKEPYVVLTIPKKSRMYVLFHKYIFLPFQLLFSKHNTLLIPFERYSYLLWFFKGRNSIVVCHDLHSLMNKDLAFYHKCFHKLLISGMLKAKTVLCVSEHTKIDLLNFYKKLDPNKVKVVHNGLEDLWFENNKPITNFQPPFASRYVLMVGTGAWYKNLNLAIEAIIKLGLPLVKVGFLSNEHKAKLNASQVKFTLYENIDDPELKLLYENATVFFMPSLHEGFGWPIVEAMASKCPVVTTNKGSIPEIASDAVKYINPYDIDEMHLVLKNIVDNDDERLVLIKKGTEQAEKFRFSIFSANFADMLKSAYSNY